MQMLENNEEAKVPTQESEKANINEGVENNYLPIEIPEQFENDNSMKTSANFNEQSGFFYVCFSNGNHSQLHRYKKTNTGIEVVKSKFIPFANAIAVKRLASNKIII